MKFAVIVSERKAEVHEREDFQLGPNEVLIQNRACNICTTDYQQWLGLRPHQKNPKAFGHENAGVVAETGSRVQNVKVGDRVAVLSFGPCLECEPCRQGKPSVYCRYAAGHVINHQKDAHGYYGAYGCGEHQLAQSKHVFKVGAELPFECAGFVEPLSTVVHGLGLLGIRRGERVLVIGAGTMGALNAMAARYYGAEVLVSEISEKKIERARSLGFERTLSAQDEDFQEKVKQHCHGTGPEAIIIAVGSGKAYEQAITVAPRGCRLLIFAAGYPPPRWSLDANTVHYALWQVIGTYGSSVADWQKASGLLTQGAVDVSSLIEARVALQDIQKGFERAASPDQYRVSVLI
jgi:threonine dehydrogenase-like Zn-dependent dehydrogenase